jgi:hypothetical protein
MAGMSIGLPHPGVQAEATALMSYDLLMKHTLAMSSKRNNGIYFLVGAAGKHVGLRPSPSTGIDLSKLRNAVLIIICLKKMTGIIVIRVAASVSQG